VWAPNGRTVAYPCNNTVVIADVETGGQSHLFGHTQAGAHTLLLLNVSCFCH